MAIGNPPKKCGKIIERNGELSSQNPILITKNILKNLRKISQTHQKNPKKSPRIHQKKSPKRSLKASAWVWKLRHSTSASGGATVAAQASAKRSWQRGKNGGLTAVFPRKTPVSPGQMMLEASKNDGFHYMF
jgi:hypothetical protein